MEVDVQHSILTLAPCNQDTSYSRDLPTQPPLNPLLLSSEWIVFHESPVLNLCCHGGVLLNVSFFSLVSGGQLLFQRASRVSTVGGECSLTLLADLLEF